MEPYFITCTTCQSRLKVVQEAIIGQIQACPKCRSMVLVTPPPQTVPATPPPISQPAVPPAPAPVSGDPDTIADVSIAPEPVQIETTPQLPKVVATTKHEPRVTSGTLRPVKPITNALPELREPASAQQSTTFSRTWVRIRRVILFLLAGGVGVMMAVFVFSWLIPKREIKDAVAKADSPANNGSTKDGSAGPVSDATQPFAIVDSAVPLDDAAAPPDPQERPLPTADSIAPLPQAVPGNDPQGTVRENPQTNSTNSGVEKAPVKSDRNAAARPPSSSSDLNADTGKTPDPTVSAPAEATRSRSPLDKVLGGIEKFDQYLRGPNAGTGPTSTNETPQENASTDPKNQRPPVRRPDITARLLDPITAIDFPETPLIEFLRFMSEMSTIPITVSPVVLERAKVTAATPVSVRMAHTNVAKVLSEALKKINLSYATESGHLQIVSGDDTSDVLVADWDVGGLLRESPNSTSELTEAIVDLIAPSTWSKHGGLGTISIEGTKLSVENEPQVVYQAQDFCERLRIARELATQSDQSTGLPALRCTRAATLLAKPISLNFSQHTPFRRIIRRLESDSGARILIDWSSLYAIRWGLESEATLIVSKKSLADTLDRLLEPMELSWRIVDDQMILVASRKSIDSTWDVEFHSVAGLLDQGMSSGDILETVRNRVLEAEPGLEQPDSNQPKPLEPPTRNPKGVIRFDLASKALVAALPQRAQRKLVDVLSALSSNNR